MSIDHNRIKVADLEKNLPNKILTTNNNGELEFSDSYNGLDCTVAGKVLDARQGKVLKDLVDNINALLTSDNINLNTIQELVDNIEDIQVSLSTILVNDLTTGGTTKALTAEMGKLLQNTKVDKVTGKSLLSDTEITRLGSLSNYTHPVNHPPSIIAQDTNNRFVTDAEKATWDSLLEHTHTFESLTSKPTTLAGYGISDTPWAAYLPLTGGILSGNILFSNSGLTKRGIQGTNGDNDFWFIGGGATATNTGYLEIATGDDGQSSGSSEPIYVSQYGPGDPLTGTLFRRAKLLDEYGNTSFPGSISTSVASAATVYLGTVQSSWGGNSSLPTLYSSTSDRWVMHINPHISYTENGVNGYTGSMTGSTIRFAGNPQTSSYWDLGVGTSGQGTDRFSIGRGGTSFLQISNNGGINIPNWLDVMSSIYAYGGISVGTAGTRTGNLAISNAIAIGDGDTGFRQNGDGVLETYANNVLVKTDTSNGTVFSKDITVASGQGGSNILMCDSDEGLRYIHCNSNRVGFLTQGGSWGSWCEDNGDWYSSTFYGSGAGLTGYASGLRTADRWYDGWITAPGYDANTIAGSKSGFTYSNNAPLSGALINFDVGGYGLQLNSNYGSGVCDVRFRSRNGDAGVWGNWGQFITSGNIASQNVAAATNSQFVDYLPNRTDATYYPVLWGASQGIDTATGNAKTYAFSCNAVNINSATGTLAATTFSGNGTGLTGTASGLSIGGSSSSVGGIVASRIVYGDSASKVGTHTDANAWKDSGFYENGGGGSNWPSGTWYNSINVRHSNQGNYHGFQAAMSYYDNKFWFRSYQGNGSFQNWEYAISNATIGSQSVNYATSAGTSNSSYNLTTNYNGGQQLNPQTYFNMGVGLKVAMTAAAGVWSDTLWINGYAGGDVKSMCALHFQRNGTPRMYISTQASDATTYGTQYEVISGYNIGYQSVAAATNSQFVDYLNNRTDNAEYPILWGASQGTNPITGNNKTYAFSCAATTVNSATGTISASRFKAVSDWFYTSGDRGWYNETYGGGIHMVDSTYVRIYNNKQLYVANNILATGDVTAYYSDERLKTKTGNIQNPIDKVKSLDGFYYTNNELANEKGYTDTKQQLGLSAQQVQAILPEVVTLAPFDQKVLEDGSVVSMSGENYLTVNYAKIVPLLVEAIKEQQSMIETHQSQIKELKSLITKFIK